MEDEGKKRKASEIAEDAVDSVKEAEATAPQVEVVDLTAESDDDDGVAPTEDAAEQAAADLVKSAMQTVGDIGVQKLLEQHLAREEAAKEARAAEEAKAKAKRAEEAKAITAAVAIAADEAAKEAAEAASVVRKQGKASVKGVAVKTETKVKGEFGGPERTGLARDEVFELELGFHCRVGCVDLGYVRGITHRYSRHEFDETRDDWGYQTANAAGVERFLHLFASAQSFELRVLWMLLAVFTGGGAGGCCSAARGGADVAAGDAWGDGGGAAAEEEEEPPRDPEDRLPSLHRA
ncbi:hypothetical protein DYB36_013397 [Aphanomyces astaci]|uniref:Uncharacterized protein n=1 Tax=Aphanomyces astaci TaxID=112090 RepID=A0A397A374_APHAT|nr:hypothetical protein DYB36_013397 [Aphanomyces astaci]